MGPDTSVTDVVGPAPEGTGGVIQDGLYFLTAIVTYDGSPISSAYVTRETVVFDQGKLIIRGETSGAQGVGPYRLNYEFATMDNRFDYIGVCSSLNTGLPPTADYSATDAEVVLISSATELTYTRQ